MRIGELLLQRGLIESRDLEKALALQSSVGGRLGSVLIRIGAISEEYLLPVLAEQLNVDVLTLSALPDDQKIYHYMSGLEMELEWLLSQQIVFWQEDDCIGCTSKDIVDDGFAEVLRYFFADETIKVYLARSQDIDTLLEMLRKEHDVEELFSGDDKKELRELAEEAPVIELVNNILAQAVDMGASDIHIEPEENTFRVRMRVDGVLQTRLEQTIERFPAVASRIKLISGLDIAERRLPQDGSITSRISGKEMDIRVSTAPGVFGDSVVMRLLPKERGGVSLAELGLMPDHLRQFSDWTGLANGIVLVTGPTGSGKSTTLYSAIQDINKGDTKIITVEDPVEYKVPGITQIQAHAEIGYTFARALRAILRQDPDVIMIGEIRDLETAEIAIQSALTGHLVLSTLHTNDALSAFSRLVDMGVEPFMVAASVRGVQAQRLVRKLCPHCAVPAAIEPAMQASVEAIVERFDVKPQWKQAHGCTHCYHSGYAGRLGVYEMVTMSPDLQELVVNGAPLNAIKSHAEKEGFRTLYEDGVLKAAQGLTTLEEVVRVMSSV